MPILKYHCLFVIFILTFFILKFKKDRYTHPLHYINSYDEVIATKFYGRHHDPVDRYKISIP